MDALPPQQLSAPVPRTDSATSSSSDVSANDARSDAAVAVEALLEAMSADDAISALAKLTRIAADSGSTPALLAAGAVQAVALTMRSFPAPSVQYRALSTLRAFSVSPGLRSEVLRASGLDLTLALMASDNALTVQDRGATIIANLAVGCPHRKRRLAREGAVAAVVKAMTAFPCDVQMQVRGSLALRNLSHNAQVNQYIAGKAGAVDAVLDALLYLGRSADKELLYQTIAALESMCTQDKNNRARIIERDMLSWPLDRTELWSEAPPTPLGNSSIARCGSPVTGTDISPVSSGSDPNRNTPVSKGKHVLSPTQDAKSCTDPNSLHGKGYPNPSSAHSLSGMSPGHMANETLSTSTVADTPRRYSDIAVSKPSQVQGVPSSPLPTASAAVSADADNPSVFRAVLRAVRRAPENRALLKYSLSLLSLLAWKRTDVQYRLGDQGAVEVALATVKRYSTDVPLVTRACTLLCTLCLQEANRARIKPGLGVLLRALQANAGSIPATREITAAISNALYCAPENRVAVLSRSGAEVISAAIMRVDGRDARVLEAGLCTLRNLVDGTRDGAERCAQENAISAARAALDATKEVSTKEEKRVQTQAVLLLGDIAKSAPDTTKEMIVLEVSDWVENALAKLEKKDHREAHVVGDELLGALQDPVMFARSGEAEQSDGAGHSFSFSSRWQHTRGLFLSLASQGRQSKRGSWNTRRRRSRRSNSSAKNWRSDGDVFFRRKWALGCI